MQTTRRYFFGKTAIGLFGLSATPHLLLGRNVTAGLTSIQDSYGVSSQFPSQDLESIRAVVGAAHGRIEAVRELVTARPALAKAAIDWGYGDWESALGAASHMGRRDIAEILINHGARPNLYTFAMYGNLAAVKAAVEARPGIQSIHGPHGITLMRHVDIALRYDGLSDREKADLEAVKAYLLEVGGADDPAKSLPITEEEKKTYLGDYTFGDKEDEVLHVTLNRAGSLFVARGDQFGRVLNRVDTHAFAPGGAEHVRVIFDVANGQATTLTVHDPVPLVKAVRVQG